MSEEANAFPQRVQNEFPEIMTLVSDVNACVHQALEQIKIDPSDSRSVVIACLYTKSINSFAAAVRLGELYLDHDAETICRSAIETAVYLRACVLSKEFTVNFIGSDFLKRRKLMKRAKDENSPLHKLIGHDPNFDAIQLHVSSVIEKEGFKEISFKEVAEIAQIGEIYDVTYRSLSDSAHPSPRSLQRYCSFKDKELMEVCVMPTRLRTPYIMLTAVAAVLASYDAASIYFKFDRGSVKEIDKRLTKISADLKSKDSSSARGHKSKE